MIQELTAIKDVRAKNNDLWMEILRIALEARPQETKNVLRQIKNNDKEISRNAGELIRKG